MYPDTPYAPDIAAELANFLEDLHPRSLIYCSRYSVPIIDRLAKQGCDVCHSQDMESLPTKATFELGLVFDYLEHVNIETGSALLGSLRNLYAKRLWVAVKTSSHWDFTRMIGFGFKLVSQYGDGQLCTYQYDLATYNKKRDWNNPRFWANPENWGKYRW